MNLKSKVLTTSSIITIAASILFSSSAHAVLVYKEIPLGLRAGDHLLIFGFKGTVKLVGGSGGGTLRATKNISEKAPADAQARYEALTFAVRRTGSNIVIEAKGPADKDAWAIWLHAMQNPDLTLEIAAAPVPVEVQMHEGKIDVENWSQPITASIVSGSIKTSHTEGALHLQAQRGEIQISNERGSVDVDSFGAKLAVQDLDGELDLANFGGDSTLTRVRGHVQMLASAGPTSIAKSAGSLEFENGRGALNLSEFDGAVRGRTDQGAVTLGVEGEAEVDVDSDQGNVAVRLPANSGAAVQLHSREGGIVAPEDIRMTTSSTHRQAVGRLPGDGPRGIVAIRSQSGAIRVR